MMTTKRARDFLDKELFVNRNIVTFRSLSRELQIHVNDAKIELQHYCDGARNADARAVPTYLVSGEVPALTVCSHAQRQRLDCAMDLDLEFEEADMDIVYKNKVLLVDAPGLNEAKSQFTRIHSVHIYSLSPSQFGDAGLVCTPSFKVHEADAEGGVELFSIVGKITGSHVKLRTRTGRKNTASSSKTTLDGPTKATPETAPAIKTEQQVTKHFSDKKEQTSTTPLTRTESKEKPKVSGKLDWSKAKTKGKEPIMEKAKEDRTAKPVPKLAIVANDSSTSNNLRPKKPAASELGSSSVRGVKRKPRTDTDHESESESSSARIEPSTTGGSSLKKGVVYSDEEDDSESQVRMLGRRRLQRKSTMTSDSEMSLRAMMDIDDDKVDRASRINKTRPPLEEEESSEPEKEVSMPPVTSEGEDEESDEAPIVPKKKRKPRKVIPVGRNGLKKRRVVRSRTTTDAKGYMQTEDYSSYESVEEEEEIQARAKGKGKTTKKAPEPKVNEALQRAKVAKEGSIREPKTKSASKPRGASKGGGILNFFGPEKGKK